MEQVSAATAKDRAAGVETDDRAAREMSLGELLRRPDWVLLLPPTPLPQGVCDTRKALPYILRVAPCMACDSAGIDYDILLSDIGCRDESSGSDCPECCLKTAKAVEKRCLRLLSKCEWYKTAALLMDGGSQIAEVGRESDLENHGALLASLMSCLCMFYGSSISPFEAAGRVDLHDQTLIAFGPLYEYVRIPFLTLDGEWCFGDCASAVSSLRAEHATNVFEFSDSLARAVKSLGTLRILRLDGCDAWVSTADELSLILVDRDVASRKLCLDKDQVEDLARAISQSNVEELSLRGEVTGLSVMESLFGVGKTILKIQCFLENLNSTALRHLDLSGVVHRSRTQEESQWLGAVAARFLRRSIFTGDNQHPAIMLDSDQIGAPNLRAFHLKQAPCTKQGCDGLGIFVAALVGSGAQPATEAGLNAATSRLPPNRSIVAANLLDVRNSDLSVHAAASVNEDQALHIFLPRVNLGSEDLVFEKLAEETKGRLTAAHVDALYEMAQAQADQFMDDMRRVALQGADGALKLANTQLQANSRTSDARDAAAFDILKAARVLACRVTGPLRPEGPSIWLDLPGDIRMLILSACDAYDLLSHAQQTAVIAFAADRRTIGFGRLNELVLFFRRLHLEEQDGESDGQQALKMVPVRWSWKASLQHAMPADWPRQYKTDPFLKERESTAAAFLAATGCRTPRVDRHLPAPASATEAV